MRKLMLLLAVLGLVGSLEYVFKKSGKEVWRKRAVVSKDGRTSIGTVGGKDANGEAFTYSIFAEKQWPKHNGERVQATNEQRRLSMKASTIITVIFLLLVSAAHLLRMIFRVEIIAATFAIPMWMSLAAFIFTAALAIWLWMDNRKREN